MDAPFSDAQNWQGGASPVLRSAIANEKMSKRLNRMCSSNLISSSQRINVAKERSVQFQFQGLRGLARPAPSERQHNTPGGALAVYKKWNLSNCTARFIALGANRMLGHI
jgi:hypothetical protein